MTEKINSSSGRIIETTSVKGGHSEKINEFWSVESFKKRPINEQYPKLENETDGHYENQLREIQTFTELA